MASHDLGDFSPTDQRKGRDEGCLPLADADGKYHQHGQDEAGDGRQELGDGGHASVEEAPRPPASEGAEYKPQQQPHDGGHECHDQGHSGSVEEQGKLIPPLVVCSQRVEAAGREGCFVQFSFNPLYALHQVGVVRSHLRPQNGRQDEEDDQHGAYDEVGIPHCPAQPLPEGYGFHNYATSEVRSRGSTSG